MRQRINRSLIGGQQLITSSSASGINTVVDAQQNSGASTWPQPVTTDPYFNYVPLLLNTNTTNAAQNNTFLDSSTNAFTITRNGTPTQGSLTPYQPSGYWSAQFNGSNQYLTSATGIANFSAGQAYTVECWFYTAISSATAQCIMQGGGDTFSFAIISSTGAVLIGKTGVVDFIATTGSFQPNAWYHIAVARNTSNQTRCWVNGTSVGSTSSDTYAYNDVAPNIGANSTPAAYFNGYISNLRVVKGTAIYDPTQTTITVPTGPLTAVTNTTLLTLQNNRFIDNSGNSKTVTPVNSTPIQAFQPFLQPISYSPTAFGGSGYFTGTGNYLSIARNAALIPTASQNFTFEAWVYLTQTPSAQGSQIFGFQNYGVDSDYIFYINSSLVPTLWINAIAGTTTTGPAITLNSWNHIAIERKSGNTMNVYTNGVAGATVTSTTTLVGSSNPFTIGADNNGDAAALIGYISNARIVIGSTVYGSNFTPPTTPLTAISNTQLLTNFANAGIYDAAWQNNALTVGDAQVSTTQYKWGTTSMKFDGTGDYLTIPNSQALALGSGDFTCEFWLYHTATGNTYASIYGTQQASNLTGWFSIRFEGTYGLMGFAANNSSILVASSTLSANTWHYVALVRSGTGSNNLKWYLNGVLSGSTTYTTNIGSGNVAPYEIGSDSTLNRGFGGYIQDLRITKGVARTITTPSSAFPTYGTNILAVDYLVVAGGGGGGGSLGAGGGAGGYRIGTTYSLSTATTYTVTIGSGGAGGGSTSPGTTGSTSTFNTVSSSGGGGGGRNVAGQSTGLPGGSGGGGAGDSYGGSGGSGNSGSYNPSEGNAGGQGSTIANGPSAGGGGASAVGESVTSRISSGNGGNGGSGSWTSLSGTSTAYAGGGGGGSVSGSAGTGGIGGGGTVSVPGTTNTGGGGGISVAGGSGIVILRIPSRYTATFSVGLTTTSSTSITGYTIYNITNGTGTVTFNN